MTLTQFRNQAGADHPHYVLFGHPMEHSWSPLMHNTALQHYEMDARYFAIDLRSDELVDLATFINRDQFLGANITIPYKQTIIEYLDGLDPAADKIGAVNTIVKRGSRFIGYNTDYAGFLSPLEDFTSRIEGSGAIVFGTGGASRAIIRALKELRVKRIYLVSRSPNRCSSFDDTDNVEVISYSQWTSFAEHSTLIVNATPLGMSPDVNKSPVREKEKKWLADHICYDIVYNPPETKFLRQAKEVGAKTIGGLEMLIEQGGRSFELWTGRPFPKKKVKTKLYARFEN